jgi:glycosyltransferase involved in cell wall biosynthesis
MPAPKKIKILRIIARLNIGGPAIHVINLTHYLNDEQFESKLITGKEADHEGNMFHLAREKGVEPIMLPELGRELHPLKDLVTLWKLYRIIRREKPDIVHTHTAKAGTLGRLAAKLAGVKIIVHTFHGHIFHSYFGTFKTKVFLWIERLLARWTTKVIAISARQEQELIELKVAPAAKFTVIPLGFELEKFKNLQRTGYLRRQFGIADDVKLIGIIGRLVPIKNHALLIPILQEILKRYTYPVKIMIIGRGELESAFKDLIHQAQLDQYFIFAGWQQDLPKVYPDLDVVVLTSLNEGTPVALIEALACGVPVVSTNVGGVGDIIRDGERGFLEDKADVKKFAEDIFRLLKDAPLRHKFSEQGKTFIQNTFSVERLVADIRGLYLQLLNR